MVAALAILVLGAILYTETSHEPEQSRGWAEFTMFRLGCVIDPERRENVTSCTNIGPGLYRLTFTQSLAGSTAMATRGLCCPGQIRAGIPEDHAVIVAIPKPPKQPVRGAVFAP